MGGKNQHGGGSPSRGCPMIKIRTVWNVQYTVGLHRFGFFMIGEEESPCAAICYEGVKHDMREMELSGDFNQVTAIKSGTIMERVVND